MKDKEKCYIIWNEDGERECTTNHNFSDECDLNYEEIGEL